MLSEHSSDVKFDIGHVLFIDIVGYSKLLITEQSERLKMLTEVIRATEQFRLASETGKLLGLPTGDGAALVFRTNPEAPVLCALEISNALKSHPELPVRMGIHSGPVNDITDLNEQANIAGAGINMAQRVMDCGDAGHILLSKRVADDLEQYPRWRPYLRELGECAVKHGVRVFVVNLYTDELGNSEQPKKFIEEQRTQSASTKSARSSVVGIIAAISLIAIAVVGVIFLSAIMRSREQAKKKMPPSANESSNTAIPEKSIAVLPFESLSRDPDNAFFADGVQDEILTDLARIAALKVISRTSVMQYKSGAPRNLREIGQQLGVAHVLEGSVQRAVNKIRVNAQLIDARNDAHLWAQTYDRDLADVFAIQSEIAKAIADQLQAKLSPVEKNTIGQRPTADVVAFEQYSKAKTLMLVAAEGGAIDRGYKEAIDLLNSAVARDPAFHAAFCELVLANDVLYQQGYDHTPERLGAAEEALKKAAELRPDSAETHLAHAQHLYFALRDYNGAVSELDLARRELPNDPRVVELTGYILRRQGKVEQAVRALERAANLDPRNIALHQQISASYTALRRYAEAAAALDRALQIKPDDVPLGVIRAEVDLLWRADPEPMCRFVERVRREQPASIPDVLDNWFACAIIKHDWTAAEQALAASGDNPFFTDGPIQLKRDFGEGLLARAMHDEARARRAFTAARGPQEQLVQGQKDYAPALCVLGLIDAALGNKQAALEEGRRAAALLPVSKDAINGPVVSAYFSMIAAWTSEKDLAIERLSAVLQPGVYAPFCSHYGMLKTFPLWDPLRQDPRFEQIVASFAPKTADKSLQAKHLK